MFIITIMLIQQLSHPKSKAKHPSRKKPQSSVMSMPTVKMDHNSFNFVKQPIFTYIRKSIDKKVRFNIQYTHFRSKSERTVLQVHGHPYPSNSLNNSKSTLGRNQNVSCSRQEDQAGGHLHASDNFFECKVANSNRFVERCSQFYKRERGEFIGKESKLLRWREQSYSQRFCSNLSINRLSFNLQKINNQSSLLHSKRLKTDKSRYNDQQKRKEALQRSSNNDFEDSLLFRCKEAMKGLTIESLKNQLKTRKQDQQEGEQGVDRLLLSKEVVCLQLPNKSQNHKIICQVKDKQKECEEDKEVHKDQKIQLKTQTTQREWLQPIKRRYRKYSSNCQQAIKSVKMMKQSGGNNL